jgi:hypothetical protein
MTTAAKHFNRFKQLAGEKLSVREKSDRLTSSLSDAEKKVEEIKASCQLVIKKLTACIHKSNTNSYEKHQKKIPEYSLGCSMIEQADGMDTSILTNILKLVGQAELEISGNLTEYEIAMDEEIIQQLQHVLDEEIKKIERSKKKLHSARLDMDGIRNKYQSIQDKYSPKAEALKTDLDQAINNFEQSQDSYATDLFAFLSREREIAAILHRMIILQITHHKEALNTLDQMLPRLDKELDVTTERPVFRCDLLEHLKISDRSISYVIEECCLALRERGMNYEGIFRLAASAAKLKLLKNAFDAGCVELDNYDPHTIAGALKQYLRELPDPLLTYELHSEWLTGANTTDEGERMQKLWVATKKLPEQIFDNLKYLMYFLHDLSKHHEETKMNVNNIAIVVGPNLLWSKNESMQGLVGETAMYTRIAECFIKHPEYFFGDPPVIPVRAKKRPESLPQSVSPMIPKKLDIEEVDLDDISSPPPLSDPFEQTGNIQYYH